LSVEEYRLLANTSYQNKEIVRAFFTSLFAGYRFCDVKDLKYSDLDYENKIIRIEQNKTKGKSKNSQVVTPLSQTLISFIGYPKRPVRNAIPSTFVWQIVGFLDGKGVEAGS